MLIKHLLIIFAMLSTPLIREGYGFFVGGKWVNSQSGATFEVVNPSNKNKLAVCSMANKEDVDKTVKNSRNTFDNEWSQTNPAERGRILNRISGEIRANKEKIAEILTLETGKPISQSKGEIETAIRYFEYYAGASDKIHGKSIPLGKNYTDYTIREPFGISAHILPWNFPVGMFGRDVAPALAAGNVAVVKPSAEASLSILTLAEIALEAGLLPGALNIVTGIGTEAGTAVAAHPDIDCLTFTGSLETGRVVMKVAAENITPISLELGGKNPMIVFSDAETSTSIDNVIKGAFLNAGQVCSACSRLLLHVDIYQKFLKHLAEKTRNLKVGPGIDDPDIGPLISNQQYNKVIDFIKLGIEEGATLVTGGTAKIDNLPDGYYVKPTIFGDASSDMEIAKREIFGPVLSVIQFETEEEALRIANDTCYGLVAGVFTSNLNIAHRFANELKVGQVYINEWFAGGVETPFGGYKKSGFGRLKGLEGIEHYTQIKNICIKHLETYDAFDQSY